MTKTLQTKFLLETSSSTDLVVLNISHNYLADLTPARFSPYCNLKIIDVNGTSMDPCRCQAVTMYLRRRVGLDIKNGITCEPPSDGGKCKSHISPISKPQLNEIFIYFSSRLLRRTDPSAER